MAKSKYTLKSGPFSFVFWPEISTSLRDPLGCSDLSQIFFGSSLIATEWDKIVAEIIKKTFVFCIFVLALPMREQTEKTTFSCKDD